MSESRGSIGLRCAWPLCLLLAFAGACRDSGDAASGANTNGQASAGNGGQAAAVGGGGGKSGSAASAGNAAPSLPRGGSSAADGSVSSATPDSAYMCVPKRGDTGGQAPSGGACCAALGTCTATDDSPAETGLPHDTCSSELRCVPKSGAAAAADVDGGPASAVTCRVQLPGAPADAPSFEGRCVPTCFVQSSPIVGRLQQASCAPAQLCEPCFDPLTGVTTGVCERDGDAPKEAPPAGYATCGDELGYCVPSYAAGMATMQLSQLTCAASELCAPKIKAEDPSACFDRCPSSLGAGACVPMFLAANFSSFLDQSNCPVNEICGPCEVFGTRTGVCD
jgi:hypothetical protein